VVQRVLSPKYIPELVLVNLRVGAAPSGFPRYMNRLITTNDPVEAFHKEDTVVFSAFGG
jgi:hypothetical protein